MEMTRMLQRNTVDQQNIDDFRASGVTISARTVQFR